MKPTIYWIDGPWLGKLAIVARPRGNEWLEDEIEAMVQSNIDVIVSLLTSDENHELGLSAEAEVVHQKGATFKSFPITDYGVPESENSVRGLITALDRLLAEGKSVGIHCRQGIGRSSLIAACLLSTNSNVDDSFKRISSARGTHVPDTEAQLHWVKAFAKEFESGS